MTKRDDLTDDTPTMLERHDDSGRPADAPAPEVVTTPARLGGDSARARGAAAKGAPGEAAAPELPHLGPIMPEREKPQKFETSELAMVLSHYDIGVIHELRRFNRGSRRAPKLRIAADEGDFLLKRRAPGRDDPYRVAFAHDLMLRLAAEGFPVPAIVGTRDENNSMLQRDGRIYELFEFVHGSRFNQSPVAAARSGQALGALHRILGGYRSQYAAPEGSYHLAGDMKSAVSRIPNAVSLAEPNVDVESIKKICRYLHLAYEDAAERVAKLDYARWPKRTCHGDWHPGNLLYEGDRIAAVLDFDSARHEPRVSDVANAALQFSMRIPRSDDPATWPDGLEAQQLRGLVRGYDQAAESPLSPDERAAIPWLMIEALVLESVIPIAATGAFARILGSSFLAMIERKVRWIRPRAAKLVEFLEG